jgi:hypothetical protein
MVFRIELILFALLALTCHFANAQTHNDDLPDLSKFVYSDLANGCRNNKNMKYLIAGTWGLMLEDEVQSKISLIKSCNKETAYKLLNALYETQPDLFKENLHAIGLSVQECQECADAILTIKKKELNKVKAKEISILDQWMKEGVPDDVEPNVNATLKYSGIAKTASFLESLDKNDKIKYLLKIEIEADGSLGRISTDAEELMDSTYLFSLFAFEELSVEQPAYYEFPNIEKGIAMSSIENVSIFESRKSITHYEPWDAPEYQAGDFDSFSLTVKYNLSKNTIKLVKYEDDENWFDRFCNQNNFDKAFFIENDIKKYLTSKELDGKIRIKCQVRKRKVVVKHAGKLLAEQEIKPKLIVINASTK